MNKIFSFIAGSLCGAVVGATIALLLAPASGEELRGEVVNRWEEALNEARQAVEVDQVGEPDHREAEAELEGHRVAEHGDGGDQA